MPADPLAELALVMTGAPSVMVIVTNFVPVPVTLVAPTVTVRVSTVVGVPEITPVVVFKLRPAGKVPVTL